MELNVVNVSEIDFGLKLNYVNEMKKDILVYLIVRIDRNFNECILCYSSYINSFTDMSNGK